MPAPSSTPVPSRLAAGHEAHAGALSAARTAWSTGQLSAGEIGEAQGLRMTPQALGSEG